MTAFRNPDDSIVVVLFNEKSYNIEYNLNINDMIYHDNLDSNAIIILIINGE